MLIRTAFRRIFATVLIALISHDLTHRSAVITSILPGYMYCKQLLMLSKYLRLSQSSFFTTACHAFRCSNTGFPSEWTAMAFWVPYTLILGLGMPIILDVVVMYNLFTLVVMVQDVSRGLSRHGQSGQRGRTQIPRKTHVYHSSHVPSPALLSPPPTDISIHACIRSLRV